MTLRITSLALRHVRRWSGPQESELDPKLNIFVGPNDCGKSTIFHALRLIGGDCGYSPHSDRALGAIEPEPWVRVTLRGDGQDDPGVLEAAAGIGFVSASALAAARDVLTSSARFSAATAASETNQSIVGFTLDADLERGQLDVRALGPSATLPGASKRVSREEVKKFLFSPNYIGELLPVLDSVTWDELSDERASTRTITATTRRLLQLGRDVGSVFSRDPLESARECDSIANRFRETVSKLGVSDELPSLKLRVDGSKLSIFVESNSGTALFPSSLGAGRNWLLSFVVSLAAGPIGRNTLLLLDEPGVHLDPRNQKRIRGFLERLSEQIQVCYSTHSPYLIRRDRPETIVQVDERRFYKRRQGADFAKLRAALGIVGADTFLFGAANLVVEGESDRTYVERFAASSGAFDLDEVGVVSAGGAPNVEPVIRVLRELGTSRASLFDNDREGRRQADAMLRRLQDERVFFVSEEKAAEIAIEDLLDQPELLRVVNQVHQLTGKHELRPDIFTRFRAEEGPAPGVTFARFPVVTALEAWVKRSEPDASLRKTEIAMRYCEAVDGQAPTSLALLLARIGQDLRVASGGIAAG